VAPYLRETHYISLPICRPRTMPKASKATARIFTRAVLYIYAQASRLTIFVYNAAQTTHTAARGAHHFNNSFKRSKKQARQILPVPRLLADDVLDGCKRRGEAKAQDEGENRSKRRHGWLIL